MSQMNKLVPILIIGLIVGAGIGWVVYPAMNPVPPPGPDFVQKTVYDALKVESDAAKAEVTTTKSALTKAQTDLATAQSQITAAQAQIEKLKAPKKIGLVLATGGLGDKSFNDGAYAGVLQAKNELGITFDYVQPKAIAEYEGYHRDFAKSGQYALIICIGYDQADALAKIAGEYPDQKFVIVDMPVDKPNVASLLFKANEGSFLVGVVAAKTSITGKVGFVGGIDIPLIRDFFVGFEAGAKWANPQITVLDPVFVGGWGDPTKGKELAVSLVELGGDAIFAAGGKSGLGALEGIHEKGVAGFGVDSCQCYLYPEIKASATKRVDIAVYEMILKTVIGKFQGGVYSKGVAEGWTGCCRLPEEESFWENMFNFKHSALPSEALEKLMQAQDKIITGEIKVPSGF